MGESAQCVGWQDPVVFPVDRVLVSEVQHSGQGRDDKEAYEEVAGVAFQHRRIAYHAVNDKLQSCSNLIIGRREQNIYIANQQPLHEVNAELGELRVISRVTELLHHQRYSLIHC